MYVYFFVTLCLHFRPLHDVWCPISCDSRFWSPGYRLPAHAPARPASLSGIPLSDHLPLMDSAQNYQPSIVGRSSRHLSLHWHHGHGPSLAALATWWAVEIR